MEHAASEIVWDLVVQNSFALKCAKAIPTTEVIEDVLFSVPLSAFTSIVQSLEKIGEAAELTELEREILRTKCSNIVSFPDNLANFVGQRSERAQEVVRFDYELYNQRLSDAFWGYTFSSANHTESTGVMATKKASVVQVFVQVAVQRGFAPNLFKRFTPLASSLLPKDDEETRTTIRSALQTVTNGVLAGSVNRKSFKKRSHSTVLRLTKSWNTWLQTLLTTAKKYSDVEPAIVNFFLVNISEASPQNDSDKEEGSSSPSTNPIARHDEQETRREIQRYVFDTAVAKSPTSREQLRFIYTKVFTQLTKNPTEERSELLPEELKTCLKCVFAAWESSDLVTTSGDPAMNESIFHSVMYALVFLKEQKMEALPDKLLAPFLNGVTVRLQCVHLERQAYGMAAAAAFAAFFVKNDEVATGFLQNNDFSAHLQKWLAEEASHGKTTPSKFARPKTQPSLSTSTRHAPLFVRTEIGVTTFTQPLNPDAPHFFFMTPNSADAQEVNQLVKRDVSSRDVTSSVSLSDALPAFGVQKLEEDEADVAILRTFRESYDSIMGIGKGANVQMHETQQAIEAGLYGMVKSLAVMKKGLLHKGLKFAFPAQLDPLIPSLLPVLMSLSIYAPEDKTKALYGIRYDIVVELIQLSPKVALHTLSGMIYGSNYGVYQRVEMVRAAGDAAKALASIEIHDENEEKQSKTEEEETLRKPEKRLYPPIPATTTVRRQSIILDEGKHTRRWGNAVRSRMNAKSRTRRYLNVLGDVAPLFVTSLLARLDADHFKFFQETDPYVPAEIIRTLVTVFQGITKLRHVAPPLCEQNIEFFFSVAMHHPHLAVKKQAWVATGEIMRCWCGAPPALESTQSGYSSKKDFSYSSSLMFGESWVTTLDVLHSLCMELERKQDPAFSIAVLTVSTLRDLVFEQKDLDAMMSTQENGVLSI